MEMRTTRIRTEGDEVSPGTEPLEKSDADAHTMLEAGQAPRIGLLDRKGLRCGNCLSESIDFPPLLHCLKVRPHNLDQIPLLRRLVRAGQARETVAFRAPGQALEPFLDLVVLKDRLIVAGGVQTYLQKGSLRCSAWCLSSSRMPAGTW